MDVDEKFPQWGKFRSNDASSPESRYVIGFGDEAGWAAYGRYFALRQALLTTHGGELDVSDARTLGYLARTLGFASVEECREWLDMLAVGGAIEGEPYDRGVVLVYDVWEQLQRYQDNCRKLAANGRKGGRPMRGGEP